MLLIRVWASFQISDFLADLFLSVSTRNFFVKKNKNKFVLVLRERDDKKIIDMDHPSS